MYNYVNNAGIKAQSYYFSLLKKALNPMLSCGGGHIGEQCGGHIGKITLSINFNLMLDLLQFKES